MGSKNVLAILFLKEKQKFQYDDFVQKGWDIIIIGEGNFTVHHAILDFICGGKNSQLRLSEHDLQIFNKEFKYRQLRDIMQRAK